MMLVLKITALVIALILITVISYRYGMYVENHRWIDSLSICERALDKKSGNYNNEVLAYLKLIEVYKHKAGIKGDEKNAGKDRSN